MNSVKTICSLVMFCLIPLLCAAQKAVPAYMRDADYQAALRNALLRQIRADSLIHLAELAAESVDTTTGDRQKALRSSMYNYQTQANSLQKEANEWFAIAAKYIPKAIEQKTVPNDTVVTDETELEPFKKPEPPKDEFAIAAKCPYSSKNPPPIDVPLPMGVVYKIQLGAFKKPIAANTFKGLTPITGEKMPSGVVKYYAGRFHTYAAVDKALREVKKYGFKNAYIVSYYNQKPIIPTRAQQLEKHSK